MASCGSWKSRRSECGGEMTSQGGAAFGTVIEAHLLANDNVRRPKQLRQEACESPRYGPRFRSRDPVDGVRHAGSITWREDR